MTRKYKLTDYFLSPIDGSIRMEMGCVPLGDENGYARPSTILTDISKLQLFLPDVTDEIIKFLPNAIGLKGVGTGILKVNEDGFFEIAKGDEDFVTWPAFKLVSDEVDKHDKQIQQIIDGDKEIDRDDASINKIRQDVNKHHLDIAKLQSEMRDIERKHVDAANTGTAPAKKEEGGFWSGVKSFFGGVDQGVNTFANLLNSGANVINSIGNAAGGVGTLLTGVGSIATGVGLAGIGIGVAAGGVGLASAASAIKGITMIAGIGARVGGKIADKILDQFETTDTRRTRYISEYINETSNVNMGGGQLFEYNATTRGGKYFSQSVVQYNNNQAVIAQNNDSIVQSVLNIINSSSRSVDSSYSGNISYSQGSYRPSITNIINTTTANNTNLNTITKQAEEHVKSAYNYSKAASDTLASVIDISTQVTSDLDSVKAYAKSALNSAIEADKSNLSSKSNKDLAESFSKAAKNSADVSTVIKDKVDAVQLEVSKQYSDILELHDDTSAIYTDVKNIEGEIKTIKTTVETDRDTTKGYMDTAGNYLKEFKETELNLNGDVLASGLINSKIETNIKDNVTLKGQYITVPNKIIMEIDTSYSLQLYCENVILA